MDLQQTIQLLAAKGGSRHVSSKALAVCIHIKNTRP